MRPPPSLRKPQVFDATPNRAFLRGFPFSQFSDFGLCQRLRVSIRFLALRLCIQNSVTGGRDRARGWTAVPIENQSRTYWWCSPPKIWRQKIIRRYARTAHPSPRRDVCGRHYNIFMYDSSRWRRWHSPNTTTWSRHSRRIEPISRSAYCFAMETVETSADSECPLIELVGRKRHHRLHRVRGSDSGEAAPNRRLPRTGLQSIPRSDALLLRTIRPVASARRGSPRGTRRYPISQALYRLKRPL